MTTATAFRDTLERIAHGRHVSLSTYRKDGRAIATPLWFVRDGERPIVMTAADSGPPALPCRVAAVRSSRSRRGGQCVSSVSAE